MNKLFTNKQIEEIKKLEGLLTQKEIAKLYHTDRRRIGEIFNGTYCNRASYVKIEDSIVDASCSVSPIEIKAAPPKIHITYWSNI